MTEKSTAPQSLKPGYFLGQEAMSVPTNALCRRLDPYFKPFLTIDGARNYFDQIAGKVDGLDYCNYWYEQADGEMARKIAELGRSYSIDFFAGIRWHKQFRDLPPVPAECVAWAMDASGRIAPALWEQRNHPFDYLNPQAVDWMMEVLEERYWPHVKGVVNGFIFPECRVVSEVPYSREGLKPWTQWAYSPCVLQQWRDYCADHDIRHEGQQLDRFPVAQPHQVGPHPDKTVYIPDNRPAAVPAFTRFVDIPRGTDIWLAWEDFLCEAFHTNFVHRIAARVNRYNADNRDWRGVCFFNNDVTMLDYRDFKTPASRTGLQIGAWPQGRRMGVDIRRLLNDPEITCVITETIESVRDYYWYDENSLAHGRTLAHEHHRQNDYGFMVHYCDAWGQIGDIRTRGAAIMDDIEEDLRWEMIHKYRPPIFSFFSIPAVLVREGAWYNKDAADRFWKRVIDYKRLLQSDSGAD
jgi:hypothetical protein